MRQTLFRIVVDQLFTVRWVDPEQLDASGERIWIGWGEGLYLGRGWFLVPWALLMAWWLLIYRPKQQAAGQPVPLPWAWLIGFPALLLSLPLLARHVLPLAGIHLPETLPVFGFGFMLFCAFLFAGWNAILRANREGLPADLIWDAGLWLFAGGVVGCRLFHLVQYWDRNFGDKHTVREFVLQAINVSNGGMVLYGGVILGGVAFYVFCKRRGVPPLYLADILIPSVFLGEAFGRIGCFLNGCCYGDPCPHPWGVLFPAESIPYTVMERRGVIDSTLDLAIPLHPTQLYSALNAFMLYLVTSFYFKYRQQDGAVVAVGLLCYPVTRFMLEYLRADELGQFDTRITISQWVSLGAAAAGVAMLLYLRTRPRLVSGVSGPKP